MPAVYRKCHINCVRVCLKSKDPSLNSRTTAKPRVNDGLKMRASVRMTRYLESWGAVKPFAHLQNREGFTPDTIVNGKSRFKVSRLLLLLLVVVKATTTLLLNCAFTHNRKSFFCVFCHRMSKALGKSCFNWFNWSCDQLSISQMTKMDKLSFGGFGLQHSHYHAFLLGECRPCLFQDIPLRSAPGSKIPER